MSVYPLILEPILKEKVWGGDRLARLNKDVAPGARIGESWELADLASSDPGGGGGGAQRSRIANGSMRGLTLDEAITALGPNLMGSLHLQPGEVGFPLLLKYLDAKENLSVQVHPSPAYAAAHEDAKLKTESWYVVDAEPGSVIYKGIKAGVTAEQFTRHIHDGSVVDDLIAIPARAGEFHHLPSGTCHALGAGVMVAEIQTPSDTTFRVFDWGRTGRELHVEQALECLSFDGSSEEDTAHVGRGEVLVETGHYGVREVRVRGWDTWSIERAALSPMILMVIEGEGRIEYGDGIDVAIHAGVTIVLPAALGSAAAAIVSDAVVLEIDFPQCR